MDKNEQLKTEERRRPILEKERDQLDSKLLSKDTPKAESFDDDKKEWECEDRCLEEKSDNNICGTTDHF